MGDKKKREITLTKFEYLLQNKIANFTQISNFPRVDYDEIAFLRTRELIGSPDVFIGLKFLKVNPSYLYFVSVLHHLFFLCTIIRTFSWP